MKTLKWLLFLSATCFTHLAFSAPSITEALTTSNPLLLESFINGHAMLVYLGIFFTLGILLAFTPCVLPMVPILSGIIIKKAPEKRFWLSLSYVLGMALMYALSGMMAALLGKSLQAALQNPYVLIAFALVFILLGLNLLGLFEIRLPQIMMLNRSSQKGGYFQTVLMGALSTLIVSPCVTAPLIGVLSFIAQTQQILLGGVILFVLALGMGVPLLLVGAGGGRFLPQTGPWMNAIKYTFGFMMFAMSIYLLNRVLPKAIMPLLWGGLILTLGLFIALKNQRQNRFIYIAAILISSLGLSTVYQSIASVRGPVLLTNVETLFKKANTISDINKALTDAKRQHKKVFLDFYAGWCSDCTAMDSQVFTDERVQKTMQQFVAIRVDITEDTQVQRDIKKAFHIVGTPTMMFYHQNGDLDKTHMAAGFVNTESLLTLFKNIK